MPQPLHGREASQRPGEAFRAVPEKDLAQSPGGALRLAGADGVPAGLMRRPCGLRPSSNVRR
eukprot:3527018-Pyramimonas_sp.AAC.1